jgi:outer membrane protein OmpA-like peptidoglycan-associated protein
MRERRWLRPAGFVLAVVALSAVPRAAAFDAQEFSPAVDPEGYFSVYSSRTAPRGRFHFSLWYDYVGDPITSRAFNREFPTRLASGEDMVEHIHTIDLVGSYSLLDWLELGIDVPFSDVTSNFEGTRRDTGLDAIRLLAKAQLTRERTYGLGFALVPFLDLPTGDSKRLSSDGETDFGFLGVADFVHGRFRASANAGYKVNQEGDLHLLDLNDGGDEILYGLGAGLLAIKNQPMLFGYVDNVEVIAELFGSTIGDDPFRDEFATPLEMLGGARFYGRSGLYFTFGIGESLTDSINGAAVRVIGSLGYTPPPPPPAPLPPAPPPPPPPAEKLVVTEEQIITLEPIYFDFDKATIKPVSYPVLDEVAKVMRDGPTIVVRVEGHTDDVGSDAYNARLSERRAHSVVKYLVAKGIDPARLQAIGFGESRPIATNDTPEGRAKNRRTEFHIVTQGR